VLKPVFDRLMSCVATHIYVSRLNTDHMKLMITYVKKLSFTFFYSWHVIDIVNVFLFSKKEN